MIRTVQKCQMNDAVGYAQTVTSARVPCYGSLPSRPRTAVNGSRGKKTDLNDLVLAEEVR